MDRRVSIIAPALAALAACNFSVGDASDEEISGAIVNGSAPANGQVAAAPAAAVPGANRGFTGLNPASGPGAQPVGGKDPAAAVPAMPAAAPGGGVRIQPSDLVGRWADDQDCKMDILIRPNGTFRSYTGGEGRWSLSGDVLTFTGSAGSFRLRLTSYDGQVMTTVNQQNQPGRSRRC